MQKRVAALGKMRTRTGTTWWVTGFPLWGQRGRAAPYCSWREWSRVAGGYGVTQREAGLNERRRQDDRAAVYGIRQPRPQQGTGRSLLLVLGKGLSAEC